MTYSFKMLLAAEIAAERTRQEAQHGGDENDDKNRFIDWAIFIGYQLDRGHHEKDPAKERARMVKIAALAVAAIEAYDRRPEAKNAPQS